MNATLFQENIEGHHRELTGNLTGLDPKTGEHLLPILGSNICKVTGVSVANNGILIGGSRLPMFCVHVAKVAD